MKTKSILFFSIVIIVIAQFGCSKDETPTSALIVGKWQVDSIYNLSQDSMIISTNQNSYGSKAWIAFNDTATKFLDNGYPIGNINGWSIMNQFWASYNLLGTSRMKLKVIINTMVVWAPFDYTFWNAMYNDSSNIKFNATPKKLTLFWEDSSNIMYLTRKE
jgi:hypothetical protein